MSNLHPVPVSPDVKELATALERSESVAEKIVQEILSRPQPQDRISPQEIAFQSLEKFCQTLSPVFDNLPLPRWTYIPPRKLLKDFKAATSRVFARIHGSPLPTEICIIGFGCISKRYFVLDMDKNGCLYEIIDFHHSTALARDPAYIANWPERSKERTLRSALPDHYSPGPAFFHLKPLTPDTPWPLDKIDTELPDALSRFLAQGSPRR